MNSHSDPALGPISELEIWIHCLIKSFSEQSPFFPLRVEPQTGDDLTAQVEAVEGILRRSQKLLQQKPSFSAVRTPDPRGASDKKKWQLPDAIAEESVAGNERASFVAIQDALADCIIMVGSMELAGKDRPEAWRNCRLFVRRWLMECWPRRTVFRRFRPAREESTRQVIREQVLDLIAADTVRRETAALFSRLYEILRQVRFIHATLARGVGREEMVLLFSALSLDMESVQRRMKRWKRRCDASPATVDAVGASLFAVRLEARRVFEQELSGIRRQEGKDALRVRFENAAGVLGNCCLNVCISLARSFNPDFDTAAAFGEISERRQQSARLYEDLRALEQAVASFQGGGRGTNSDSLLKLLERFRNGSMRYLMFRDWEPFEDFLDQVRSVAPQDFGPLLHRFEMFLQTLIDAVGKRESLSPEVLQSLGRAEATYKATS